MAKIKIASSYAGKISTGSYENASPFFSAEIEVDLDTTTYPGGSKQFLADYQKELQEVCYNSFKAAEQKAILERIQKERADFRWYPDKELGSLPSVTSIINYDADFGIPPQELQQYASQSQLCHAQVSHFILTKEWLSPEKLNDTWADLVIVKKGSLSLETEGWDFPAFLSKYPINNMKVGTALVNKKYRYGGTPDFYGIPNFEGATKMLSICDVKRSVDKVKNFMQMAAYAMCDNQEKIKQMIIVPLNNKTAQGYSKPVVSVDIDKYFEMFLRKREEFKKRYGV